MEEILILILIFIFGAACGSFLNVLAERLPRGESIRGRSHCDHCGAVLGWRDLIPIASFLILRGRCRACKAAISCQYLMVELVVGILFVLTAFSIFNFQIPIFNQFSNSQFINFQTPEIIKFIYLLFLASCFVVIFISDLKYFIIPDQMIIVGVGAAIIFHFLEIVNFDIGHLLEIRNWKLEIFTPYFLTALAASAFFLLIVLLTRGRGMGLGDVKLAFLMGLILGWPLILPALFLAFTLGAIIGVILILARKAKMKSEIPFGPFLIAGTFLALFFGEAIFLNYF